MFPGLALILGVLMIIAGFVLVIAGLSSSLSWATALFGRFLLLSVVVSAREETLLLNCFLSVHWRLP